MQQCFQSAEQFHTQKDSHLHVKFIVESFYHFHYYVKETSRN